MALQLLEAAVVKAQVYLAAPVNSGPVGLGDAIMAKINELWGKGLTVFAIVAVFAGLAAAGTMLWQSQRGGGGDGASKLGWVAGACIVSGLIAGLVGGLTGT